MAVNWAANVVKVDSESSSDLTDMTVVIRAVKLVGGSGDTTLNIKEGGSSGTIAYTATVAAGEDNLDEDLCLRIPGSAPPRVELSGSGGEAYLYLK